MPTRWKKLDKAVAALVVTTPIAFLGAVPWLKAQNDTAALSLGALAAAIVMGGALFLSARVDGRMDEVQRAGTRFASHWGMAVGGALAVTLAMLPPLQHGLARVAASVSEGPGDSGGAAMVFTAGICTAIFLQAVASGVFAALWRRRMNAPQ